MHISIKMPRDFLLLDALKVELQEGSNTIADGLSPLLIMV